MAFQPLPDGVRAVLKYGYAGGREWSNTFWLTRADFTETNQQDLANLIQDEFENMCDDFLQEGWSLLSCTVYDMRSEFAPIKVDERAAYAGSIIGQQGAINAALVVTLYTATRGKSGRGRHYITGFSEDDMVSDSVSDTTVVEAIEDAYNAWIDTAETNGWTWVVASGQQNKVVLENRIPYAITSCAVRSPTFGSQRRRIDRI